MACIFSQPLFCAIIWLSRVLSPRKYQDYIILLSCLQFVIPSFDPQQQWQNERWQGDFEVCSCFLVWHCPHSPQSWKFSAWEAPHCPCQLLVLSALNICCFLGRGCRVENEQISNCILTASSPKVPSYLAKCRTIKVKRWIFAVQSVWQRSLSGWSYLTSAEAICPFFWYNWLGSG